MLDYKVLKQPNILESNISNLSIKGQNVLLMDYLKNQGTLCPNNGYFLAKRALLIIIKLFIYVRNIIIYIFLSLSRHF